MVAVFYVKSAHNLMLSSLKPICPSTELQAGALLHFLKEKELNTESMPEARQLVTQNDAISLKTSLFT